MSKYQIALNEIKKYNGYYYHRNKYNDDLQQLIDNTSCLVRTIEDLAEMKDGEVRDILLFLKKYCEVLKLYD